MIKLKGITWDHDRGYLPLVATGKMFTESNQGIEIEWTKRSLKEFGDFPVEELAKQYDLLLIDHPFTGEACKKKLYEDLSNYMTIEELQVVKAEEIGNTYDCYNYDGKQLALPVDAAALVAASRDDLFAKYNLKKPENLEEIFELAKKLPEHLKISIPLCSTDIWCLFLSLCANIYGSDFIDENHGINEEIGIRAMEYIKRFKEIAHEKSIEVNPIQILDDMASKDEIIYCPFLFGYVNYSIEGNYNHLINFYNSPLINKNKPAPILGGVGIAISQYSQHKDEAAKYVKYVTLPEIQEGVYLLSGGQPSHKCAWESDENNRYTNDFFKNTEWTIRNAYLRPRVPSWNKFQEEGSVFINECIVKNLDNAEIVKGLNELYKKYFLEESVENV